MTLLLFLCFKFKNDITWVLNDEFFVNDEFFRFTLSNFVNKILWQTLRRRANLEKLWYVEWHINFEFLTHLIHALECKQQWSAVLSSLPDCLKALLIKFYKIMTPVLLFIIVLQAFKSVVIIFHNFLKLHSTLSEKVFIRNFHFLMGRFKPPTFLMPKIC